MMAESIAKHLFPGLRTTTGTPYIFQVEMAKYNASRDPEYRHLSCHALQPPYFGIQGSISMCCYNQKIHWGTMVKGHPFLDLWCGEKHNLFVGNSTIVKTYRRRFRCAPNL